MAPARGLTTALQARHFEGVSIAHLRKWDVTPIEIAIDLEAPRQSDPAGIPFSGAAEPRVCLVAAFALTSHLKRIAAAVERAIPQRPPAGLHLSPSPSRSAAKAEAVAISVRPMPPLVRLQSKLLRAIEPGLAHVDLATTTGVVREMGESAAAYIRDFVPTKALPAFEPAFAARGFAPIDIKPTSISIYRLGQRGAPESILASWAYSQEPRYTLPLRGGP